MKSPTKTDHFLMDLAFLGVLAAPFSVVFTLLSQTWQTQRPVEIYELHITTQSIVIIPDVYDHHKPRIISTYLWVWSPFPRRRCGTLGHICRKTSSHPHGEAADTQCRSYTPYIASCMFGWQTPVPHSCPSRMDDLKYIETILHAQKQIYINKVRDQK